LEIEVGSQVIDKNGEKLGEVVKVVRDTWSGEINKFLVSESTPANGYLFATDQVLESNNGNIRLDHIKS
jgi:sporulation protein YlmC with PRC-barrel domain